MITGVEARTASKIASLTGPEKVAVLLLALGKTRAAKLLKWFDPEDLKAVTRSASDLQLISTTDLEALVEEFAHRFSSNISLAGTAKEIKELLANAISEEEVANAPAAPVAGTDDVWEVVSKLKVEVLRGALMREHPQTSALVLSKIESEAAAKVMSSLPTELRAGLLCRMLAVGKVPDEAMRVVEVTIREEWLAATASTSYGGIADILNRLDKAQSEEVLKSLEAVRPKDAKALKNMLFTFEDLVTLPPQALTLVMDQVPIDKLVLALKGTDAGFQAPVLSTLTARSRRMVEAELQGGSTPNQRDVVEARRGIVDAVLRMVAKGEIQIRAADDLQDITA